MLVIYLYSEFLDRSLGCVLILSFKHLPITLDDSDKWLFGTKYLDCLVNTCFWINYILLFEGRCLYIDGFRFALFNPIYNDILCL
jgi:hypothetical protein